LSSIYILDILGTKQDIAALSKFLEKLDIFTKNGTGSAAEYNMEDSKED